VILFINHGQLRKNVIGEKVFKIHHRRVLPSRACEFVSEIKSVFLVMFVTHGQNLTLSTTLRTKSTLREHTRPNVAGAVSIDNNNVQHSDCTLLNPRTEPFPQRRGEWRSDGAKR
jgi:hypothetical protein